MNSHRLARALIAVFFLPASLLAQTDPPAGGSQADQEAIHNELRAFRDGLLDSVSKQDVNKMLSFLTRDVVVTWQNSEVIRGHEGVSEYFERVQGGTEKVFLGYLVPPTPDDLTILYDNRTGISFGNNTGRYMVAGREIQMRNRWTATLVKQGDRWLAASYHVSTDVLDNPVLDAAKSMMVWGITIAFLVGLAGALIVAKLLAKKKGRAISSA